MVFVATKDIKKLKASIISLDLQRKKKESELIPAIQKLAQELAVDLVMVKADEGVAYGKVITLVDAIKSVGGITYVALATQKPRAR